MSILTELIKENIVDKYFGPEDELEGDEIELIFPIDGEDESKQDYKFTENTLKSNKIKYSKGKFEDGGYSYKTIKFAKV